MTSTKALLQMGLTSLQLLSWEMEWYEQESVSPD
jgi:hypothetical protein